MIEHPDHPTMNPRNTRQLRALVERREVVYLWGQKSMITPRLCGEVFGDGRRLLGLSPIMFRPNYFVVRIDSKWSTSNWDCDNPMAPGEWLDQVYDAIDDEYVEWPWAKAYGLKWTDDRGQENSSRIDWSDGCEWWEMDWPRLLRKGRSR